MFRFNPQKIDFENKLFTCATARFYPYRKNFGEYSYIVKHVMAHDIDELLVYLQEIIIGSQSDHPNLISVQGYHIEKIQPRGFNLYIKYEKSADTIAGLIEKHAKEKRCLPEAEVVRKFYDMACGLEYLHSKKITHKYLKPSVVFVNQQGKAQLGGIGVNEALTYNPLLMNGSSVTSSKAPEMQNPSPLLKRNDLFLGDIWSLGAIIAGLCFLKSEFVNYTLQNPKKIEADIQKKIKALEGRYSKTFVEILLGVLRWESSQRMSLKQIKKALEDNYGGILGIHSNLSRSSPNTQSAEDIAKEIERGLMLIEETKTVSTQPDERKFEEELKDFKSALDQVKQDLETRWRSLVKFNLDKEFMIEPANPSRMTDEYLRRFMDDAVKKLKENDINGIESFDFNLFGCDKVTDQGIKNLTVQVQEHFKSLKEFSIGMPGGSDQITDYSVKAISNTLLSLKHIDILSLNFNFCKGISEEAMISLSDQIGHNFKRLRHLSLTLSFCEITDKLLMDLSFQIGQNLRSLEHLSIQLAGCKEISDQGIGEFAEHLGYNLGTMRHLDLSFSHAEKLTDQSMTELAIQIGQNLQNLEYFHLDFGGCEKITDQGLSELAIHVFPNLKKLHQFAFSLAGCIQVTDQGIKEFADSIQKNSFNLMFLCVSLIQTQITLEAKAYLKQTLSAIPSFNLHS